MSVTYTPTLAYVGAIDLANSFGSTMYNILFDSAITTSGNVLMFEYKLQPANVTDPAPNTITLGFIDTENSNQNSGITNQWQICVPAQNSSYNPSIAMTIQVRVYYGILNSPDINVTNWSNPLNVHNPPPQPIIETALYNQLVGEPLDDIYVVLQPDSSIDYNQINFILAYYYQDLSNNTVWNISEPLSAVDVSYNNLPYKMVSQSNFGNVYDASYSRVYTSAYAVYPFVDASNNYYSVSHISNTFAADEADNYLSPVLDSITYKIYNPPSTRSQVMTIAWTPPESSFMPGYTVSTYTLEYSTDASEPIPTWNLISNTILGTVTSYDYDVSAFSCATTLSYRVKAVFASGDTSLPSNEKSENIFKYASAPLVAIIWAIDTSYNTMDVKVGFSRPLSLGCGDASGNNFVAKVYDPSLNVIATKNIAYDALTTSYIVQFSNITYSAAGVVNVYLQTTDTNSSNVLDGDSGSAIYATGSVPIYTDLNTSGMPTALSFNTVSATTLNPVAGVLYPSSAGARLNYVPFNSSIPTQTIVVNSVVATINITLSVGPGGEYVYAVLITASVIPVPVGIVSSNQAGIGELSITAI